MQYVSSTTSSAGTCSPTDAAAGYVILEHYPEQKVFIDDRYDMYPTVGDLRLLHPHRRQARVEQGARPLRRRRDRVGQGQHLAALLDQSPGWQRVHRDATDAVWVRSGTSS